MGNLKGTNKKRYPSRRKSMQGRHIRFVPANKVEDLGNRDVHNDDPPTSRLASPLPWCSFWKDRQESSSMGKAETNDSNQLAETIIFTGTPRTSTGTSQQTYVPEGRRLIDFNYLFQQIQALAKHPLFDCTIADMEIVKEHRKGIKSSFFLKCKMCNLEQKLNLFDDRSDYMDMNTAATLASISTGFGFSTSEAYMSVLNVPFMSPDMYQQCHEDLGGIIHQTAWPKMEEPAEEETVLARELGQVDWINRPCITVVDDQKII